MHLVLSEPSGGQLWLGGIAASGSIAVLRENNVANVFAAAANPFPARAPWISLFGPWDGTGIITGSYDLKVVVSDLVRVARRLCSAAGTGHTVRQRPPP
jgi:hypothetical protein